MKKIIIYSGRFQPFSKHHYEVYKHLKSKFPNDDVYIATSDTTNNINSPFSFEDKKKIAGLYGLENNIVKVKNPYKCEEITSKHDKNTPVVFAVGEKDMSDENSRFKITDKSYFKKYTNDNNLNGYIDNGYLYVIPNIKSGNEISSASNVRQTLKKSILTGNYNQKFKEVFGKYDEEVANLVKNKLNEIIKESFYSIKKLITEGGAAGHMAHLFDLDEVVSGNDLIDAANKTTEWLATNESSVKIDGVNASLRFVNLDNKYQFVLDRGSNKLLDVKGITKSDLKDRFGEGHGFLKIGAEIIDIFNASIPYIKNELKDLGVINNPNVLFNCEYVSGKTNVQDYQDSFIAIHGLLEMKQVSPTKRQSVPYDYDKSELDLLIEHMNKVAPKYGFKVVGSVGSKLDNKININSILSKSYIINYTPLKKESKTLKNWLQVADVPKNKKIKLLDGTKVDVLSKKVFMYINDGGVLNKMFEEKDYNDVIMAWATYLFTMLYGDIVLQNSSSELGKGDTQEGIVIKNKLNGGKPYKLTGKFIINSLNTQFTK